MQAFKRESAKQRLLVHKAKICETPVVCRQRSEAALRDPATHEPFCAQAS
jgi:hypothetical protein